MRRGKVFRIVCWIYPLEFFFIFFFFLARSLDDYRVVFFFFECSLDVCSPLVYTRQSIRFRTLTRQVFVPVKFHYCNLYDYWK